MYSLSKRSNLAGYRAGFLTGDPALVAELLKVRRHAGLMMPAPVQAAMVAALDDDTDAEQQRARYAARRVRLRAALEQAGWTIEHSEAGLYLWATRPGMDCWGSAGMLAGAGILVAPGEFYGPAGRSHIRVALTATDERIDAAASARRRIAVTAHPGRTSAHRLIPRALAAVSGCCLTVLPAGPAGASASSSVINAGLNKIPDP